MRNLIKQSERPLRALPWLTLGLLLAGGASGLAARFPVTYDVEIGYGGIIPAHAGIFPVVLTIDNKVASTEGVIEIFQPEHAGGNEVTKTLPIVTASPSIKRFTMLTRIEPNRDLQLRVRFDENLRDISKRLSPKRETKPIVASLGLPKGYNFGEATKFYKFAQMSAEYLPDDPLGLDALHAVMITGGAFATLTTRQIDSLRSWVETGGVLLMYDPVSTPAFEKMLLRFLGETEWDTRNKGLVRMGAGALSSSGDSADPREAFWEREFKTVAAVFPELLEKEKEQEFYPAYKSLFTDLWQVSRSYSAGGFFWILLIVGAYICVIGPLDKFVVKKMKKPYLTWILFPVAIAVFSFVAYQYSSFVNIGTMRAVHVSVVDTAMDADTARGNSIFWIHSAKNEEYVMNSDLTNVCFSGRESELGAGAYARVNITQGQKADIRARIPIFSAKEFDASWYMPWPHKVEILNQGPDLDFQVARTLEVKEAWLVDNDGIIQLHEVEGEKNLFRFDESKYKYRTWPTALMQMAEDIRGAREFNWYGRDESVGDLPEEDVLRQYLLCLSYPKRLNSGSDNADALNTILMHELDHRERTLDVRRRLSYGNTLVLVLDRKPWLFPVKIKGHSPEKVHLDVIRIHLPERLKQENTSWKAHPATTPSESRG